ncbi:MAG: hypothetical protein NTW21_18965, partial [Verrucomicrobia bacterium]|nr:hypothetical protein [Verrucomicrobiota bacterium]
MNFLHRLETNAIRPAARDYYIRWAEAWINPPNGLMSDDCRILISEVTERRIPHLPFKPQKSTLSTHQSPSNCRYHHRLV